MTTGGSSRCSPSCDPHDSPPLRADRYRSPPHLKRWVSRLRSQRLQNQYPVGARGADRRRSTRLLLARHANASTSTDVARRRRIRQSRLHRRSRPRPIRLPTPLRPDTRVQQPVPGTEPGRRSPGSGRGPRTRSRNTRRALAEPATGGAACLVTDSRSSSPVNATPCLPPCSRGTRAVPTTRASPARVLYPWETRAVIAPIVPRSGAAQGEFSRFSPNPRFGRSPRARRSRRLLPSRSVIAGRRGRCATRRRIRLDGRR